VKSPARARTAPPGSSLRSLSLERVVWFEALVVPVLLERRPTLANRGVRAAASVVLELCEGRTARGKKAANDFDIALGSARETLAVVDLAVALRFVEAERVERLGTGWITSPPSSGSSPLDSLSTRRSPRATDPPPDARPICTRVNPPAAL